MGLRKMSLGGFEVLVVTPSGLGKKLKTLGGLLPGSDETERLAALPASPSQSTAAEALQKRVNAIEWYHTIDLGNGVVTPGWFDLRAQLGDYPIPASLAGKRVLDVATFDGFWAFEFERRGAAEVTALDIDSFAEVDMAPRIRRQKSPEYLARKTGEGFRLCHEALGSNVRREILNVYDLSPERLGKFDFVFISDVLLHLMNPMKALHNIASVTADGGMAVIADVYNPALPDRLMRYESGVNHNTWWSMSLGALEQMVRDAGFGSVELANRFMTGYRGERPILAHAAFVARP